ncbi:MAG: prephenate dehydrogenase/arogenate dehydrogenase family protein [Thermoplasmata archaeon]
MPSSARELTSYRRRIDRLDREIAHGVRLRLELARQVARSKSRHGLPLRDYEVERAVVERWVRRLRGAGIESSRSESFARWLIEESVRVQEPIVHSARRRSRAGALDLCIVGGAGAMGQWLGEFFESGGHRVSVIDPRAPSAERPSFPSIAAAADSVDGLVFATPMAATATLLSEAIATGKDVLMFDILSVKAPIAPTLRRGVRAGRSITSIHPMFGPSARTLSGRNLLVVGCGNPRADAAARSLFAHSALTISEVSLSEHDRLMAESLGLSHAVNLLFLGALAESGTSAAKLSRVASTTFHRQSSLALSVAREGVELYLEIQASNPHSTAVYRALRSRLNALERIVAARDLPRFRRWLAGGRSRLEPGSAPMRP